MNRDSPLDFLQGSDGGVESIDEFIKRVMSLIKVCRGQSNDLQGWENYADYSGVQSTMLRLNNMIHKLIKNIFMHQDIKLDISGYSLSDQFEIIREGNDAFFEKINSEIDEASGIRRNADAEIFDSTVRTIRGPVNNNSGREVVLMASRNVQKPQLFFNPKINNSKKEPFIPKLIEKPNSMKPLSVMICLDKDGVEYYSHPYEYELLHFNVREEFLEKVKPKMPLPISKTPLLYVENPSTLQTMVDELKHTKEIAVDLENHSFRSYQGLTSLIQISSRDKDYIIDPFTLRNHLPLLNEVFTDPKIMKVFHGADHDILWLQRDCGVYVVNMFDTHQAAIVLEYPHRSLANLLYTFCSITANKNYQRADWRIRPLPEDFIEYARHDSHYLLYIYDLMKNELIEKGNDLNNLLHATYNRSTELCLKRYEKPIVGPDSHLDLYRKSRKIFNSRQLYALQKLYLWRDETARQHDESVDYVLPKHMMLQIAEVLPKEVQGILACCNPIPTLIKTEQLTLHQIIRAARELPLDELNVDESQLKPSTLSTIIDTNDIQSSIMSKHDLSLVEDDPKGLSTLLSPQETLFGDLFSNNNINVGHRRHSQLFGLEKKKLCCQKVNMGKKTEEFMSPFERYNIFLKFMEENNIQPLEESPLQKETTTMQMRIDKVRQHFMSLNEDTNSTARSRDDSVEENTDNSESRRSDEGEDSSQDKNNQPEAGASSNDQNRLERILAHVESLANVVPLTPRPKKSKKKRNPQRKPVKNIKEEAKMLLSSNAEVTDSTEERLLQDSPWGGKKRKSSDFYDDSKKKIKPAESDSNDLPKETSVAEDVEPYDYSKANFSIFKPKKRPNKRRQNIKQRFRGKGGSNKPTGETKSGQKSLSWGSAPM